MLHNDCSILESNPWSEAFVLRIALQSCLLQVWHAEHLARERQRSDTESDQVPSCPSLHQIGIDLTWLGSSLHRII